MSNIFSFTQLRFAALVLPFVFLSLGIFGSGNTNAPKENQTAIEKNKKALEPIAPFTENLSDKARAGEVQDMIGVEGFLEDMSLRVLNRKFRSLLLIGERGAGKTAMAEYFARQNLDKYEVIAINPASLLKDQDTLRHLQTLLEVAKKKLPDGRRIIVFIDEIHMLFGENAKVGGQSIAEYFKTALANGQLTLMGTTTREEYTKHFTDPALRDRLAPLFLKPMNKEQLLVLVRELKNQMIKEYQAQGQNLVVTDRALQTLVNLVFDHYTSYESSPSRKAQTLLEMAVSRAMLYSNITSRDLGTNREKLREARAELKSIEDDLKWDAMSADDREELLERRTALTELIEKLIIITDPEAIAKITALEARKEQERAEVMRSAERLMVRSGFLTALEKDALRNLEVKEAELKGTLQEIAEQKKLLRQLQQAKTASRPVVDVDQIAFEISKDRGYPVDPRKGAERILGLAEHLDTVVQGQQAVTKALQDYLLVYETQVEQSADGPRRFLLAGTSGVGKSELALQLARFVIHEGVEVIKLSGEDFKEKSSATKLVGSDPGYVGYGEGHRLTPLLTNKNALIQLDDVHLVHPEVLMSFMAALDQGFIQDATGKIIDLRRTILVMSANVSQDYAIMKTRVMAQAQADPMSAPAELIKWVNEKYKMQLNPAAKVSLQQLDGMVVTLDLKARGWPDELIGRLGPLLVTNTITPEHAVRIAYKQLMDHRRHFEKTYPGIKLEFDDRVAVMVGRMGTSELFGVRELKKVRKNLTSMALAQLIATKQIKKGDTVRFDVDGSLEASSVSLVIKVNNQEVYRHDVHFKDQWAMPSEAGGEKANSVAESNAQTKKTRQKTQATNAPLCRELFLSK